jgi:hypothetical protein
MKPGIYEKAVFAAEKEEREAPEARDENKKRNKIRPNRRTTDGRERR